MFKFVRKKPLDEENTKEPRTKYYKVKNSLDQAFTNNNDQNSSLNISDTKSSLSTLTSTSKSRNESFVKIKPNQESQKNSNQSAKVKRSFSHHKKNTTSSDKSDNQLLTFRSSSTSSLNTLSSTTLTKETSTSSSSSLTSSLQTSTETLANKITIYEKKNETNINKKLIDKLEHLIRSESQNINKTNNSRNNAENNKLLNNFNFEADTSNNTHNKNKFVKIKSTIGNQISKGNEEQRLKMVLNNKNVQKPKSLIRNRNRTNLNLSSEEDEEKHKKNSKNQKNVNFRIVKLPHQQQTDSNGSYRVIAQQPVHNPNNRIPVLIKTAKDQHYVEISSAPRKRVRSPSNCTRSCSIVRTRDNCNSLLNLALRQSQQSRVLKKITIKPLPRSLSVNYLYRKRQGDLRRFQKNALIKISLNNRSGFTTEDIDDIYMPKQFDIFERKVKASMDISDNSELEDIKMREQRLSRVKNCCKRIKQDIPRSVSRPRIIINYRVAPSLEIHHNEAYNERKSYLEEAKRKLDKMKNSKGYYYNLNNKLKSSVTNLIKASHDLARTSELRNRFVTRNSSLKEVYDIRRNQIRSNNLNNINSDSTTNIQNSYTCDDIDNVYMPWMIENYGRKLAIEAMRRRVNISDKNSKKMRTKSPYVSQYYAKSNEFQSLRHNDLWLIDRDIRRYVKKNDSSSNLSDVSMTDTETSSDDTRPIVPEKIKKPDNSLKNKILKAINKSLLTSEMTGIDLNVLKLNDCVRRTLKRIEKKALERDLEHDLIRSFSCSHLADLRKEDIKYMNMRIKNSNFSYSTEDIEDLYIPRILENYKLKLAVEKERNNRSFFTSNEYLSEENLNEALITSPPPIQIKSPSSIATPLSPNPFKTNTDSLFKQIIQERLSEFDYRMASEISSSAKRRTKNEEDAISTDNDQDESIEISSDSDDFNINEDELKNFETKNSISKSKIESTINKSLTLKNPGELISDFYISNMNYAMRYSVEYIQHVADEMRRRRQMQDSIFYALNLDQELKLRNRLQRSFSVDRLYAVRKEHLRYSNGAEDQRISFTTDDIQDIYMPSSLDNYKRKIAVELERRRRFAELYDEMESDQFNDNLYPVKSYHQPVILDDLDIFIIKRSKFSVQQNDLNRVVQAYHPTIQVNQAPKQGLNYLKSQDPPVVHRAPDKANLIIEPERLQKVQINQIKFKTPEDRVRFERANLSIQQKLTFFENYPLVTKIEPLIQDEPIPMDQANVLIENYGEANNYPLINKVNTITDNELLQENLSTSSESSLTSSITTESSDFSAILNLDSFEPKKDLNQVKLDKAKQSLVESDDLNHTVISKTPLLISNNTAKNKKEQVPTVQKPVVNYETHSLHKASISCIQPLNMATQLNEQFLVHKSESLGIDQPVDVKKTQYVIEEYTKKPLNSQVTTHYENLDFIYVENQHTQIADVKIGEKEIYNLDSKTQIQPINVPKMDYEDQLMTLADQIEIDPIYCENVKNTQIISKVILNEPASMLIPVNVKKANQIQYEEDEIMEFKIDEKTQSYVELNEVPLEITHAHVTEFKNVEKPDIDEISLSSADSFTIEPVELSVLDEKVAKTQVNEPILSGIKNKIYNVPKELIDSIETGSIEEFVPSNVESYQIEQLETVKRLETCQKPARMPVLSLARQDSIKNVENKIENILTDQIVPEFAVQKQEVVELNFNPSIQKPMRLNAPLSKIGNLETLTTECLEIKEDVQRQQTSFVATDTEPIHEQAEIINPVLFNSAKLTESINSEQIAENLETELVSETIEFKRELNQLNTSQNLNIKTPLKAFNLGNIYTEELALIGLNELEKPIEESDVALIKKEDELNLLVEEPSAIKIINCPVISKNVEDFLETVKPVDTFDMDFEESISIKSKRSSLAVPNDIRISIKKTYGQPEEVEEILRLEKCSDIDVDETTEPIYRENKIGLSDPSGLRIDVIEKNGFAKVEITSQASEEPAEFITTYSEKEEFIEPYTEKNQVKESLGHLKSEMIFNSPSSGQVKIETLEKFSSENIKFETPSFVEEKKHLSQDQIVSKVQRLNAPNEIIQVTEQHFITTEITETFTEEEIRIVNENLNQNECNLKVGIDKKVKYNLAALNESSEDEKLEIFRENTYSLDTVEQITSESSSFYHGKKDTSISNVKNYGRSQEIIEIFQTHNANNLNTSQSDEINPTYVNEPFYLITEHSKSKSIVISVPKQDEMLMSTASLDSLDNIDVEESKADLEFTEKLNKVEKIDTLKPFNLHLFNEIHEFDENIKEFNNELNAENPIVKIDKNLVNETCVKDSIKFFNLPNQLSIDDQESNVESLSQDVNSITIEIPNFTSESKLVTAQKQFQKLLNAPLVQNVSMNDSQELDEFEFMPDSEHEVSAIIESNNLATSNQPVQHIKLLNAPRTDETELKLEQVQDIETEVLNENKLESKMEERLIETAAEKSKIKCLNAPKYENESFSNFEETEIYEPESKEERQLESKLETEKLNLHGQLKSITKPLNAAKFENLSLSHLEDVDRLEISDLKAENPVISHQELNVNNNVISESVSFLMAPKPEFVSLTNIEEVEHFETLIPIEQSKVSKIETGTSTGISIQKLTSLNAPKIENFNQNLENIESFESNFSDHMQLALTQSENHEMEKCYKNQINLLNAPKFENLSHSFIERADSFETRTDMMSLMIKNESLYHENYVNIQEPVRILMREMEDAIEYSFNEGAYSFNFFEENFESVEYKRENSFLNNKPDKKLLLWLNYPKIMKNENEEEEAKKIDENFDYLYEKIIADIKSNEPSVETDSNLVQIEKVLSLFISNQDHVEYHEEILKFLPNSRPELQRLILNQEIPIKFERASQENIEQQTRLKDLSFDEDSIEEMSQEENKIFKSDLLVELGVKEKVKPNSRVVFNLANLNKFFDKDESLKEIEPHTPSHVSKITHQSILKNPSVTSLEQKLDQIWVIDDSKKDVVIPIGMSQLNWDENEHEFFTSTHKQQKTSFSDDENTLTINTEDETGSFFEQIENYQIIETNINSTIIDESTHDFDMSLDSITNDKINIEIQKANESGNDTDSTSISESSGKMHLIESVEVLTHSNQQVPDSIQIQKIDINRLKIKEKVKCESDDPKARFKVNFKQEEILDLRNNDNSNISTNREFAKKFVEQIINLSASKLDGLTLLGSNEQTNCNFDCISTKNTNEILESLSNIKCDLAKHFTDSLISECGQDTSLVGEQCVNMNLMEDVSEREDMFENFSNRLHSSSNYGRVDESFDIKIENELDKSNFNNSKDKEVIEILAQIVKERTSSNCSSDSEDSLDQLKKTITLDSMQSFLDNVVVAAKNTINSKIEDFSDQDDETSIQEILIFNQNFLDESNKKKIVNPNKYKINTIKSDKVDDFDKNFNEPFSFDFGKVEPINASAITKVVEKSPDILDFDETVEIVDSVVIDHVSEDDKSTTSEEVTFERWTEETKLIKTKIFKDGNLVDEIVEQSSPELVGNILREKIIERHEHIKHISQDVLKRVRVKSPGQSRRESLDIKEIMNEDLDGSNIIIVEPTVTSIRPSTSQDNTLYIQHQQVITPTGQTSFLSGTTKTSACCSCFKNAFKSTLDQSNFTNLTSPFNFDLSKSNFSHTSFGSIAENEPESIHYNTFYTSFLGTHNLPCAKNAFTNILNPILKIPNLKEIETKNDDNLKDSLENLNDNLNEKKAPLTPVPSKASNINTYYGGLKAVSLDDLSKDPQESVLIVRNDEFTNSNSVLINLEPEQRVDIVKSQYEKIVHHVDNEENINESINELKNKSDSMSNTSDSFGSIQRFERPTKLEMQMIQQEKLNNEMFFYEETTSTLGSEKNVSDKTIEESMFKGSENLKREDLTDFSDYENNIFLNNTEPTKSSSSVDTVSPRDTIRRTPLRRESFELAQRDTSKRLSIAKSTTSSSSSSLGTHQIIIKPVETIGPNNNKRLLSEIKPSSEQDDKLGEEPKNIEIFVESDSDESDILKRNYEILRKKTSEKILKNELNEPQETENLETETSFVSSHLIKSEQVKPSVKPTKIKIVKKQKLPNKDTKFRSVSPGLLRGPDVIETIETTTSMSFIMNKSINLVTEEKIQKNSPSLQRKEHEEEPEPEPVKSIPIPIHVQTRSKSEPKIKQDEREIKVTHNKSPRVTFHKYDSNEIIAVVNVPEDVETKTVKSVVENYENNCENSYETSQLNNTKSHSKSTPNLNESSSIKSKLDSWKKWPEYTVDQETDTSILSNDYTHCWIKETPDSRVVFRNNLSKDKDPEFEIEIEKILPVHDYRRKKNKGHYSTHSIINTNMTHTEHETIATRMSSGYFSGDEFKSQMLNYSPSYSTSNFSESPRTSSSQFNINKFLHNNARSKPKTTSALEEFNRLYESLGLDQDEALLERANARDHPLSTQSSSIKQLISNEAENYSDYYYRKSIYSRKSAIPDTLNDDMSRQYKYVDREVPNSERYQNRSMNLNRDDASILNTSRKRSNSMSNLNNDSQNNSSLLILPSPTTADYLRNRTRESALLNVVMKPAKTTTDFEISQILYDDMAYRQLRKDSDAYKLSQIKANKQNIPNNLVNITSLPISYAPGKNVNSDYYPSSNSVRTIKMIKQKDASNKSHKQNVQFKNSNEPTIRYFTNESNSEINDYYDCLNHVKILNKNYGN